MPFFHFALRQHIAKKNGSPHYQVRALNVRSLVETSAGYPTDGETHALEALDILQSYPAPRLKALVYISLARVYRYQWNQAFQHQINDIPRLGKELLSKALAYMEGSALIMEELKWAVDDLPKVPIGAIDLLKEADKENWVTAFVPPQVKMEFLASKIRHYPSPQPKL